MKISPSVSPYYPKYEPYKEIALQEMEEQEQDTKKTEFVPKYEEPIVLCPVCGTYLNPIFIVGASCGKCGASIK